MGIKKLVSPVTEHIAGEFRAQRARLQSRAHHLEGLAP